MNNTANARRHSPAEHGNDDAATPLQGREDLHAPQRGRAAAGPVEDAARPRLGQVPARPSARQPAREANIRAIVSFFEGGIKQTPGELGIELEHIIVGNDLSPVSYSQPQGIQWVLKQLEPLYPATTCDPEGDLLGVARPGEAITIEPAAQLELSAGPFLHLADAQACFEAFEDLLAQILGPTQHEALAIGYHPTAKALDLELIPKRRYKFMDLYLGARGMYGPCMMRGSASTQVSIDYTSVEDCLRKLRLAFALVPLFSLICDNSPVFEGAPRAHQLVRTKMWQHCDPDRCGIVPGVMDASFDLRDLAAYVLDAPAILIPCKKEQWCYSERTFGDIYAETPMGHAEVEHALSMFFTDVRLKTYIEIRPADSMPIPYVIAYAALVKGLFYAPASLDALDRLFAHVRAADIDDAKEALMAQGYEATVYGSPVAEVADELVRLARTGLDATERAFLDPLAELVSARDTLACRSLRQTCGDLEQV